MRRTELESLTKKELLEIARELEIPRRSMLSKDGLIRALAKHRDTGRKSDLESGARPSTAARRSPAPTAARKKKTRRRSR